MDQAVCNAACGLPSVRISDVFPVAQRAIGLLDAAGHEALVGLGLCPLLQSVRHAMSEWLQRILGLEVVRAGDAIAQGDARDAKLEWAKCGGVHFFQLF